MEENRVEKPVRKKNKMMLIPVILALTFFGLYAQHGKSPDGLDTWMGQITALNPDKQEITLTAKKASETFILPKEQVKPGENFSLGQSVRVVYVKMKQEINGKWVKMNTIIAIEKVAPQKGS